MLLLCLLDSSIAPWNIVLTHHWGPMMYHPYCVLHAVHIQFSAREFSITFRWKCLTAAFSLQKSLVVPNLTFPCSFPVLTFNVIFRHAPSSSRSIPLPSSFDDILVQVAQDGDGPILCVLSLPHFRVCLTDIVIMSEKQTYKYTHV